MELRLVGEDAGIKPRTLRDLSENDEIPRWECRDITAGMLEYQAGKPHRYHWVYKAVINKKSL